MRTTVHARNMLTKALLVLKMLYFLANFQDRVGETPLWIAAGFDQKEIAKLLLENGADVNVLNNKGEHMIHKLYQAVKSGEPLHKMLMILLPYVDQEHINVQDGLGSTFLHYAVLLGEPKMVKILLDMGPDLYKLDRYGEYALDKKSIPNPVIHPEIIDRFRYKVLNEPESKHYIHSVEF